MGGRGAGSGIRGGGISGGGAGGAGGGASGGSGKDALRFERKGGALSEKLRKALEQRFASGSQIAREIYDHYIPDGGAVKDMRHKDAYYSSYHNRIWMSFLEDARNPRGIGTTWLHEHGHFVDYNVARQGGLRFSADREFQLAIIHDVWQYESNVARIMNPNGRKTFNAIQEVARELIQIGDSTNAIQDIFGGVHRDRSYYDWGHKNVYWTSDETVAVEAAAHMFEAQFGSGKADLMEKYLPTAWKRYNELLEIEWKRLKKSIP